MARLVSDLVGTYRAQPICEFVGSEAVGRAVEPLQYLLLRKARYLPQSFPARGCSFGDRYRPMPEVRKDGHEGNQLSFLNTRS